jgi:hypothetical protein
MEGEDRWMGWRQQKQTQRTEERSDRYGWLVVGLCAFCLVVVFALLEKRQCRQCHQVGWPGDCRMMVVRFVLGGGVVFGSGGEWCCGGFAVAAVVVFALVLMLVSAERRNTECGRMRRGGDDTGCGNCVGRRRGGLRNETLEQHKKVRRLKNSFIL